MNNVEAAKLLSLATYSSTKSAMASYYVSSTELADFMASQTALIAKESQRQKWK